MAVNDEIWILNRFTTLPVLLDLLERKKLVLLDPKTWEDKNDSGILLDYKERKGVESLFALCFSMGLETIHHWKTYSDGTSGCCIEFNGLELQKAFNNHQLRHGPVVYKKINEISDGSITFDQIPFTKRYPYRCEEEYRVIFEGSHPTSFYEIPISLRCIRKVTINQRMPDQVYKTIKSLLISRSGNPEAKVNRSTLFENRTWLNKFKKI